MAIKDTVALVQSYLARHQKSRASAAPPAKQSRSRTYKRLALAVSAVFLMTGIAVSTAYSFVVSEGQRTGIIRKLSYKGLVFKTGEAELVLQGIRGEGTKSRNSSAVPGVITDVWEFSSKWGDEATYRKLEAAMDAGQPVVIKYQERFFAKWQLTQTPYIVTDIKPLGTAQ